MNIDIQFLIKIIKNWNNRQIYSTFANEIRIV